MENPPLPKPERQSTGIARLDTALGGGLLPGTLTVIVGATGVGKTQLGIQWCSHGKVQEGRSGALVDMSSRGDPQNHADYAMRLARWSLTEQIPARLPNSEVFENLDKLANFFSFMGFDGKRVLRSQLDVDQYHAWQSQLNRRTPILAEFVYRQLIAGARRFLVDGIEPQDRPEDSLQLEMFEYMYHRLIRQEHDWLARELFRQEFRSLENQVRAFAYENTDASAAVLVTTRESLLDQLIEKPLASGDLLAGANTVLLMGRTQEQGRMGRGLFIAKHRGSYCDDSILPFSITDAGLSFGG